MPDDEAALPVAEPGERHLVVVDAGDVPAVSGELFGDRGADPPTPDDHCLHELRLLVEHTLGERDDEHLARRVAEDVVDRR